ncbi:MAG: ribonuclease P protein component [Gammaproteobacteria bacterium]|nr:ribonuclease P protein component [Gammaproteobacteria bacterium]
MFAGGRRIRTRYFTLIAAPGDRAPRLGMAIGRRCASRAVVRNRMKRMIRETFRQAELPACDVVVTARPGVGDISRQALRDDLRCGLGKLR